MASAKVNLIVNPEELQIIDQALRLLRHVAIYIYRNAADPLENWVHDWRHGDGDPRTLGMRCEALSREIGLK